MRFLPVASHRGMGVGRPACHYDYIIIFFRRKIPFYNEILYDYLTGNILTDVISLEKYLGKID